jgi:hypothetical protein
MEGGVGFVFYLNQTHCFHLKYAVGRGSNNKGICFFVGSSFFSQSDGLLKITGNG